MSADHGLRAELASVLKPQNNPQAHDSLQKIRPSPTIREQQLCYQRASDCALMAIDIRQRMYFYYKCQVTTRDVPN